MRHSTDGCAVAGKKDFFNFNYEGLKCELESAMKSRTALLCAGESHHRFHHLLIVLHPPPKYRRSTQEHKPVITWITGPVLECATILCKICKQTAETHSCIKEVTTPRAQNCQQLKCVYTVTCKKI